VTVWCRSQAEGEAAAEAALAALEEAPAGGAPLPPPQRLIPSDYTEGCMEGCVRGCGAFRRRARERRVRARPRPGRRAGGRTRGQHAGPHRAHTRGPLRSSFCGALSFITHPRRKAPRPFAQFFEKFFLHGAKNCAKRGLAYPAPPRGRAGPAAEAAADAAAGGGDAAAEAAGLPAGGPGRGRRRHSPPPPYQPCRFKTGFQHKKSDRV
jgi:hypothetical protein